MERLGADLNATGSVMTRSELEEQRRKRGECLTCGRKCFNKKLFKMVPITDHGRVLEGRCLNCRPLEVNSQQTVLPAETRPATRAELERFNRSQRNLSSGGLSTGGSARGYAAASGITSSGGRQPFGRDREPSSSQRLSMGRRSSDSGGAYSARILDRVDRAGGGGTPGTMSRERSTSTSGRRPSNPITPGSARLRSASRDSTDGDFDVDDSSRSAPSFTAESGPTSGLTDLANTATAAFAARELARKYRERHPERSANGGLSSSGDYGEAAAAAAAPSSSTSLRSAASGRRTAGGGVVRRSSLDVAGSLAGLNISGGDYGSRRVVDSSASAPSGGLLNRGGAVNHTSTHESQRQASTLPQPSESAPPQAPVHPADEEERKYIERLNDPDLVYEEILSIMRSKKNSPLVQEEALLALSEIHLEENDRQRFAALGGLKCGVAAMKAHAENVDVQIAGCQALWNLSATPDNQAAIGSAGGIVAILNAMIAFDGDADLQENAMAALSNLGACEANHPIIIENEGVRKVVEAMNRHSENAGVQEKGCAALTNLASKDVSVKSAITAAGGADAVVIAMVMHPGDVELQQKALRALRNLCANDDENKMLVANVGGIDAVIGAMQVHRDNAGVQEAGAWTLSNLALNAENKAIIGESGGIDVIVRAMWVHSDYVGVQEWACRALWTLSVDKNNKDIIVEVGGISAVVNAMQAHADAATVQEKGCGVLANLAANDDNNKVRIVEEEALDAIVMAMVIHGDNKVVQQRACTVLHKLCYGPNIKPMRASNVVALMQTASEKFPEECKEKTDLVLAML